MSEETNGNKKLSLWLPTIVMLFIYIISFSTLWGALNARVDATEKYIDNSNQNMASLMIAVNDIKVQLAIISNTGTARAIENSALLKELQMNYQSLCDRVLTIELNR